MSFSNESQANQGLSYLLGRFSTAIIFYRRNFLKNKFYTKMCCCSFNLQEEIVLSLIIIIKLDDTTPLMYSKVLIHISCCVELKSEKLGYVPNS
jgi:hypothetical protein